MKNILKMGKNLSTQSKTLLSLGCISAVVITVVTPIVVIKK